MHIETIVEKHCKYVGKLKSDGPIEDHGAVLFWSYFGPIYICNLHLLVTNARQLNMCYICLSFSESGAWRIWRIIQKKNHPIADGLVGKPPFLQKLH